MQTPADAFTISTPEQLDLLFVGLTNAALKKEVPYIHPLYQQMIAASPFMVLSTIGPGGLDASPRGDPAGFVVVEDEHTLLLPERRGNNRVDSLRNIVHDPRVALLFLIPGVGETLRVNGRARISIDPALLQRFAVEGKLPKCVIVVTVETAYFQCARAMARSRLWQPVTEENRARVPSAGQMLEAVSNAEIDGAQYDAGLAERQRTTLY